MNLTNKKTKTWQLCELAWKCWNRQLRTQIYDNHSGLTIRVTLDSIRSNCDVFSWPCGLSEAPAFLGTFPFKLADRQRECECMRIWEHNSVRIWECKSIKELWMSLTSYLILYSLLPWVLALGRVHWARREAVPCWPWLRNVHAAVPEHNFWIRSRFKKRCLPAEVWNWSAVLGIKVVNPRLWHGSCPSIFIQIGICFFLSWNHRSRMKLSAKHKMRLLWSGWCQT